MNNSKQTVLSIVGIAILVIAVVGVSFAFFTYSRTGTTNNVITTGSITFDSDVDTEDALVLDNEFPQAQGYAGANHDAYTFHVSGNLPTSAQTIYYGIYVVEGDAAGTANTDVADLTQTVRFQPEDISIIVTNNDSTGGVVPSYNTGAPLTSSVSNGTGILVAYGSVPNSGALVTRDLSLKMWINNSVTISDTDTDATYRAKAYHATNWPEGSASDTRTVYSDLYYTLKVKVEANDSTPYYTPAP